VVLLLKIILHLVADVPNAFFVLNKQMPVLSVRNRAYVVAPPLPAAVVRRGTMLQRCYRTDGAFLPICVPQGPLLVCVAIPNEN
jgi:hypothetical protein